MATRKTPELNLKEAEPLVLSRDFNLIYQPETEPLPQGTANFLTSLDNFVRGTGSQMIVTSELKQKKEQSAKAVKDHAELKTKFRTAISKGNIKPTANPYYLEKYKELSLNAYASQFSDALLKAYGDNDVATDISEGAFDRFYADELKQFITKNNLGQFDPIELEKGFFTETSAYRNQLEATHKSNLLNSFSDSFDDKVKFKVVGVIQKYKNLNVNALNERGLPVNRFQVIADALQDEISELIEVNGDGRVSIDTVFDGLALYVSQTEDFEFAKKVIRHVPKLLIGGTDTIENIGRIKAEQNKLKRLLFDKANEALNSKNNFEKNLKIDQTLKTFNFIENEVKKNSEFNVIEWKNDIERTAAEIDGVEAYIISQSFDGGNSDYKTAVQDIELLIEEGKFSEAHQLVKKYFKNNELKKGTYENYIRIRIPDAKDFGENPFFDIPTVSGTLVALKKTMESGRGKDAIDAVAANAYLKAQMTKWLKLNQNNEKYIDNLELMEDDFEAHFIQKLGLLKQHGDLNLFGKGTIALEGGGTLAENIEARIEGNIKKNDTSQKDVDEKVKKDLDKLSDEKFEKKYKISKEEMRKAKGWN